MAFMTKRVGRVNGCALTAALADKTIFFRTTPPGHAGCACSTPILARLQALTLTVQETLQCFPCRPALMGQSVLSTGTLEDKPWKTEPAATSRKDMLAKQGVEQKYGWDKLADRNKVRKLPCCVFCDLDMLFANPSSATEWLRPPWTRPRRGSSAQSRMRKFSTSWDSHGCGRTVIARTTRTACTTTYPASWTSGCSSCTTCLLATWFNQA